MKKEYIFHIVLVLVISALMINPMWDLIKDSRIDENKCLEEQEYYYRVESSFIFRYRINTTQENADGIDYKCIKWEEKPSLSAALVGQELVYEKGNLTRETASRRGE